MVRAAVVAGSNWDYDNLDRAVARLNIEPGVDVIAASCVYYGPPVDMPLNDSQNWYRNVALLCDTDLEVRDLRLALRMIEHELGRRRPPAVPGQVPIDLDLVVFDDYVGSFEGRDLPSPDLLHYAHVAVPLAEIWPTWQHPITHETLAAIASRLVQGSELVRQ
jgi:2-amino-4-hydroxy-6-hydroxymethyldihydropteridine diphosphokinase